jgi:hypothetical protein
MRTGAAVKYLERIHRERHEKDAHGKKIMTKYYYWDDKDWDAVLAVIGELKAKWKDAFDDTGW